MKDIVYGDFAHGSWGGCAAAFGEDEADKVNGVSAMIALLGYIQSMIREGNNDS